MHFVSANRKVFDIRIIYDTNFFTQKLENFTCLSFLSDGNKILTPQKIKLFPYLKNFQDLNQELWQFQE